MTNNTPILLICMGLLFITQSQDADKTYKKAAAVGLYVVYLLTAGGAMRTCKIIYNICQSKKLKDLSAVIEEHKVELGVSVFAVATLMMQCRRQADILADDFPYFLTAFFVWKFMQPLFEKKSEPTINYGTGMACSYFEGYLQLIIPSDGINDNFVDKIRKLEDSQGVVFPVKMLLVVITYKTLFCPPDMKHYNKPDRFDLPQLEACRSLEKVKKDVAGVKSRRYQNSAYRIWWPDGSHPPVYIMSELATPLRTLHGVIHNQTLYPELCNVNAQKLAKDFCEQLKKIIDRSPDCRGRCELVYFDDSPGSTEYLPDVLFKKIKELEPKYLEIIEQRAALMRQDSPLFREHEPEVLTPDYFSTPPEETPNEE